MHFDANTDRLSGAEPSSHVPLSELAGPQRELTVSLCVARALVAAVEHSGVSRERFSRETWRGSERLGEMHARMTASEFYKGCEAALDLSLDPALGLRCGQRFVASTFSILSHMVAHAADLRQAIETLLRFHTLCSDHSDYVLFEREDRVVLCCSRLLGASPRVVRFLSEIQLIGLMSMIRHFSPNARIDQVCFEYSAPEYRDHYARTFEGAERFEQPFTGIVFDRALLHCVSADRDEEIYSSLSALAGQRVLHRKLNASCALRVREWLVQQPTPSHVTMENVASSLQLSVRTLHRRLALEGTTYRALTSEASALIATRLLIDQRCTIQEASSLLGFSDTSAFHRAFKRWTGKTPHTFRRSKL